MRRIRFWFMLGLLLGGTELAPLLAQPPLPTGTLREVLRLEPAAQPPGGLIPYRAGKLLAYADTGGRVVIPPFGRWPGVSYTRFFKDGVVAVHPLLKYVTPLPNDAARRGEPVRLALLNARGEVLLVRRSEAAVRQPDGSLRIVPAWQAHGQPEAWEVPIYESPNTFFDSWIVAPNLHSSVAAPARATGLPLSDTLVWEQSYNHPASNTPNLPHLPWLGIGRVAKLMEKATPPGNGDSGRRWALADAQGHELTAYKYAEIHRFSNGIAVAQLPSAVNLDHPLSRKTKDEQKYQAYYTYLDSMGQQITPALFTIAGTFRKGRAVVANGSRMGVIDVRGNFIVPLDQQVAKGPDASGYIALVKAGKTDRDDHAVTILSPTGKPPIARTFTDFGGFRQGRAEVSEGGRAGLIDEGGNWITPLKYERLRTPVGLHSDAYDADDYPPAVGESAPPYTKLFQTFHFPDSTMLVGVRAGKIGLVDRVTGQEVVSARYDTVVLNPCHGMACLRRGGTDYLVSSFNGKEVAATYQGYDFLTAQGRRLLVMRAHPTRWALADTLAQLRTPWLPGLGHPTAHGHLVSTLGIMVDSSTLTLRSPEGKRLLKAGKIAQPFWDEIWHESKGDEYYQLFLEGESPDNHYQLPVTVTYPYAKGVYFTYSPTDKVKRIYDAHLHPLGTLPNPPRDSRQRLVLMESGWSVLMETVGEGIKSKQVVRQSYTDTGQALPPPPTGSTWEISERGDYPRMWRICGVLPSTLGYVTRGKRHLWTD
ncbi:WG repeat-containing protein [Hymenobacter negativus]|uniref:WG repeat-containing protein n=1 Tax=Hymenobacter negativus TaxID=2795026 RepID=A0ABS3QCY5_9BACT|nr:WG repeat-containing protein [Hymenobacter negativus]MBO2009102.1 WG repeat-containing protein [Hymenobacter negativus]